jgi:hypothetical protein
MRPVVNATDRPDASLLGSPRSQGGLEYGPYCRRCSGGERPSTAKEEDLTWPR